MKISKSHGKNISEALGGRKLSESHKESISRGLKGRKISIETREKISSALKDYYDKNPRGGFNMPLGYLPWNKGKKLGPRSFEIRLKISKGRKGRMLTKEQKQQISESLKGRKRPREVREKISSSRKGYVMSPEHKEKVIKSLRSGQSPSKAELRFYKSLPENIRKRIDHNSITHELLFDSLEPDFVCKKDKKIIEYFGDYWHRYKLRSTEPYRKRIFEEKGYKLLVVWDSGFTKDPENEISRVVDFMGD